MNNISNDEKSHQQIEEFLIKEYNLDKKNAKLIADSFFNQSYEKNTKIIENLINNEDIKKFELELHELINYLKIHVIKDKITLIYLNRIGNTIRYGKYNYGVKTDYNTIKINKSYDLKYVYQIIKKEFSSIFTQEQKYTFFSGYNLLINLGPKVTVEINSNNKFDKEWFYEEISYNCNQEIIRQNIKDMMSNNTNEEHDHSPKITNQNIESETNHHYIEEKFKKIIHQNKILNKKKKQSK